MMTRKDDTFNEVMKGIKDPKKSNPYHREQLKKDAAKAKAVEAALAKRKGKHTKRRDDGNDGVIDTGMFGS
jgi:hypothetical protein